MIVNRIGCVEFKLKELHDFAWLKRYGAAFWALDATGLGCVCIGLADARRKYFCKIAGVDTVEAEVPAKESAEILKEAVHLYDDLAHPNLIKPIEAYDRGQFCVVVFEWADGDCLFDHWNFETCQGGTTTRSPEKEFVQPSVREELNAM